MNRIKTPDGYICHATHPNQPVYGGSARSRKLHLAKEPKLKTKTLCNMLVEDFEKTTNDGNLWSCLQFNGQCKSCLKVAGIDEIQYKPLQDDMKRFANFY